MRSIDDWEDPSGYISKPQCLAKIKLSYVYPSCLKYVAYEVVEQKYKEGTIKLDEMCKG